MNKKLYIGNLAFGTDEASLKAIFEEGGKNVISAQLITDRETGRSRGFGFVEFETSEDAANAIETLNGKEIDGRAILVSEAREKTTTGGRSGGFGGGFGGGNRDGGRPSSGGYRGGNAGGNGGNRSGRPSGGSRW